MVPFTNKVIENQLLAVFSKAGLCNVHQSKDAETSGITSGLLKILGTPKKLKAAAHRSSASPNFWWQESMNL